MELAVSEKVWKTRPYEVSDKDACLRIFDENTPQYFLPNERQDFSTYLDEQTGCHFVVENEGGALIACGGYATGWPDEGSATLCWGMVGKDWHGLGVGRLLLILRLAALCQVPEIKMVRMDTSQRSVGFFMKWGFKTFRITRDHYGPNLHRYEMRLSLDEDKKREISNTAGSKE